MRGQFILVLTFIIVLLLSECLRIVKFFEKPRINKDLIVYLISFRNIPSDIKSKSIFLKLYNYGEDYYGPLIIPLEVYVELENPFFFSVLYDKPYLIVFDYFRKNETKEYKYLKYRKISACFLPEGNCIETLNYSICGNKIVTGNSSITFNFSINRWGFCHLDSESSVFLPNSIIFFYPETVRLENFNITEGNMYLVLSNICFYGYYEKINSTTFVFKKGVLYFGNCSEAKKAFLQDFYYYKLEYSIFDGKDFYKIVCWENGMYCEKKNESRVTRPFFSFNCRETGFYNYITNISGKLCYSIRGIPGISIFSPKREGHYEKEKDILRIFEEDSYLTYCSEKSGKYYKSEIIGGSIGYLFLGNVSGNFTIDVKTSSEFWINFSGKIYEIFPKKKEITGNKLFFGEHFIFKVNSSVQNLVIPSNSILSGNVSGLKRFLSEGDTKVTCNYCNLSVYDGPLKIFSGVVSEYSVFSKNYTFICDPDCNVSSNKIFFDFSLLCPPYSGEFRKLSFFPEGGYRIEIPNFCVDNNCDPDKNEGGFYKKLDFGNATFILYSGEGILLCLGNHILNFSEEFTIRGNKAVFKDFEVEFLGKAINNRTLEILCPPFPKFHYYNSNLYSMEIGNKGIRISMVGVEVE